MNRSGCIIVLLLIILGIGYSVNRLHEEQTRIIAKKAQEEAQKEEIKQNVIMEVNNLLKKYDAFDWEKDMIQNIDENHSFAPVPTVKMEELWITDRPTLFIGSIEDVQTLDDENYLLRLGGVGGPFSLHFELELKCPKQQVKSIIEEHPNIIGDSIRGVAVIAKIEAIKTATDPVAAGTGKCIDMVYVDDILAWHHLYSIL